MQCRFKLSLEGGQLRTSKPPLEEGSALHLQAVTGGSSALHLQAVTGGGSALYLQALTRRGVSSAPPSCHLRGGQLRNFKLSLTNTERGPFTRFALLQLPLDNFLLFHTRQITITPSAHRQVQGKLSNPVNQTPDSRAHSLNNVQVPSDPRRLDPVNLPQAHALKTMVYVVPSA